MTHLARLTHENRRRSRRPSSTHLLPAMVIQFGSTRTISRRAPSSSSPHSLSRCTQVDDTQKRLQWLSFLSTSTSRWMHATKLVLISSAYWPLVLLIQLIEHTSVRIRFSQDPFFWYLSYRSEKRRTKTSVPCLFVVALLSFPYSRLSLSFQPAVIVVTRAKRMSLGIFYLRAGLALLPCPCSCSVVEKRCPSAI